MFPCQDTPSIKTTFDMTIRSILPVVASGIPENDLIFSPVQEPLELKTYKFKQEIPISNYLFAVASGYVCYSDRLWNTADGHLLGILQERRLVLRAMFTVRLAISRPARRSSHPICKPLLNLRR